FVAARNVASAVTTDSVIAALCPPTVPTAVCADKLHKTIDVPLVNVLGMYSTFRGNVPWLAGADLMDDPALAPLRHALRHGMVRDAAREVGRVGLFASLHLPVTMFLCIALLGAAGWIAVRRRGDDLSAALLLGMLMAASVGWFVLGKTHAYIHAQV